MTALALTLSPIELSELRYARSMLESPGLAAQLANVVGAPVEYLFAKKLPKAVVRIVDTSTRKALQQSFKVATATLARSKETPPRPSRNRTHALAVAATGAAGGAFGIAGLALELPVTTTLILRSIADIARSQGESAEDPAVALACMEVLTLGGTSADDDGAESGYFATRAVLSQQISAAAEYVSAHGLMSNGAPVLVQLMSTVASKFSIKISHKVAAHAVPVIGAASGAAINTLFIHHFQKMATGHFIVRRLERRYGAGVVRNAYGH